MERVILKIYEFLVDILIFIVEIPQNIAPANDVWLIGIGSFLAVVIIVLGLLCIRNNEGSYAFPVKLGIGGVWAFFIAYCAVLKISRLDIQKVLPRYVVLMICLLMVGALGFLIVNFLLDLKLGVTTTILWLCEILFAADVFGIWKYIQNVEGAVQYDKIMVMSRVADVFHSWMSYTGMQVLTGIFEYVLLIALMFVTVFYLFRTKPFIREEWIGCVAGQFIAGLAYLVYEVYDGVELRSDFGFIFLLMFCAGWFLNIFVFFYEISVKNQQGCIGAFFMGVAGVAWNCSVVFSVDIARKGAFNKSLDRLSKLMTWIYKNFPFGIHTDFNQNNIVLMIIGMIIVVLFAVLILVLLFMFLEKVLNYNENGTGMEAVWFRNCSIVLVVPVIVYWIDSMYGNVLTKNYQWMSLTIQSIASIGLALCFSNIAPALKNGFFSQLKLILVSTLAAVLSNCILVPVIFTCI